MAENSAKAVSKILGESETQFSPQFQDVLGLMKLVSQLERIWFHQNRFITPRFVKTGEGNKVLQQLNKKLLDYKKKYGDSDTTKVIKHYLRRLDPQALWSRAVTDEFWAELISDLIVVTARAINLGEVPVSGEDSSDKLAFSGDLLNEPERLTPSAITAIAKATGGDDDFILELLDMNDY